MTLETVGTIANIIASMAVVLSLIFIGLQLRQNMHLTRMSTAHTSAMLLSQNYGRVIENPDLAQLLSDSDKQVDLQGADLLRVTNFVSVSFRYFEILHTHKRYNVFEPELWSATEARLKESLNIPRSALGGTIIARFMPPALRSTSTAYCSTCRKRPKPPHKFRPYSTLPKPRLILSAQVLTQNSWTQSNEPDHRR